jgi:DNA-binding NarL/FixJ family response regulator
MAKTPSEKSRVLIVDDHPLFREGMRQMIDRNPPLKVCGEAANPADAMKAVADLEPDLVLVDISLDGGDGIDLIQSLKAKYEDLPILVISMHNESLYAERALRAGTVKAAIFKVLGGDIFVSDKMSAALLSRSLHGKNEAPLSPVEQLSNRELQVFQMLGEGKPSRQIAEELDLTIPTIHSFRTRIKEKLRFQNATELVLRANQWVRERASK